VDEAVWLSIVGAFGNGTSTLAVGIEILAAEEDDPTPLLTVATHVKNAPARSLRVLVVIV
jgi:hypothetical protein